MRETDPFAPTPPCPSSPFTPPATYQHPATEADWPSTGEHFGILMAAIHGAPDMFRRDFPAWLKRNMPIWHEFRHLSAELAASGRRRYSARTIAEVIRWNSMTSGQDKDYKVNNNWVPDMARLYMLLNPHHEGLFSLRESARR